MNKPGASPCRHCGTPSEGSDYCCSGCEAAAAILSEAGLDGWYQRRVDYAPRPTLLPTDWSSVEVVEDASGHLTARLAIDGLRCASCVWVTERLLERSEGVDDAHVSYATGLATIRWDPARTELSEVCERIAAVGYRPRAAHALHTPDRDLLMRLGIAAFCSANLMTLTAAVYIGWWQGMDTLWSTLFQWLTLLLATPVALWSAQPFFAGALQGLRARVLHMDVPISLAVAVMYLHGVISTLLHRDAYLDSLAMLVTLLLVGRVLEARGRRQIQQAVGSLASQLPSMARRVVPEGIEEVPPSALQLGDLVEVPAGTEFPADGVVVAGCSTVRMSLLTGESEPREVSVGDEVVAGGIVEADPLRIRVTACGEETLLGRMSQALERSLGAEERRDVLAPWFTAGTLLAAATTMGVWSLLDPAQAIQNTVAVLVVACPCALALARPLTQAAGTAAAARRGLLLRSPATLEDLALVTHVVFDKTGTLTGGVPEVIEASDEALRIASSLERSSAHPIARAIVREAIRRGIPLPAASDIHEAPGVGMEGTLDGVRWRLRGDGPGAISVSSKGGALKIQLRDRARPEAQSTLQALRDLGLRLTMLTGDHRDVAEQIAAPLGLPLVAEADPLAKSSWIEAQPDATLFIGDGLNDGPALAAANVGIAMGSGVSSSVLAADAVIAHEGLGPVVAGIQLARITQRAVRRSLLRSVSYNLLAVSAAMFGVVNPLVAAVLMPLSSLLVIWEASRVEARL